MNHVEKRFLSEMRTAAAFLSLVQGLKNLAATPRPPTNKPFPGNAGKIISLIVRHRDWEFISCDGVFLYIVVRFEVAVEELIERAVARLPNLVPDYSRLPEVTRKRHREGVADIMSKPERYVSVGPDDAVVSLADCIRGTVMPYCLVPEAFSKEHRNLNPTVLSELFGRIGVSDIWQSVALQANMQTHFGTVGDLENTRRMAKQRLADIIRTRNKVAHPGNRTEALSTEHIKTDMRYLKVLVPLLRRNLETRLREIARP